MDFRAFDGANPMSDTFRREAAQNVMQNMAALRNQKDLKKPDDETALEDRVSLAQPEAGKKLAGGPKDTLDTTRAQSAKGTQEAGREASQSAVQGRGERAASVSYGGGSLLDDSLESQALIAAAGGGGLLEDKDPATRKRKDEEARLLAQEGVPVEILQASQQIVKGQLHPVKGPKQSLREMKDIPEVSALETRPAEFAPEMDISVQAVPLIQEEEAPPG